MLETQDSCGPWLGSGASVAKDTVGIEKTETGVETEMERKISVDEYCGGTVAIPAFAITGFLPWFNGNSLIELSIENPCVENVCVDVNEAGFIKCVEVVAGRQPARAGPYVETTCCKKALGNDSILVVPVCRDY
jgi:hypothetical protein